MFLGADFPFLAILSLSLLMLRFTSQSKSQIYSVEKTVMEKGPVSTPETAGQVCTYVGISIDYIIAGVAKQLSTTVLSLES